MNFWFLMKWKIINNHGFLRSTEGCWVARSASPVSVWDCEMEKQIFVVLRVRGATWWATRSMPTINWLCQLFTYYNLSREKMSPAGHIVGSVIANYCLTWRGEERRERRIISRLQTSPTHWKPHEIFSHRLQLPLGQFLPGNFQTLTFCDNQLTFNFKPKS